MPNKMYNWIKKTDTNLPLKLRVDLAAKFARQRQKAAVERRLN